MSATGRNVWRPTAVIVIAAGSIWLLLKVHSILWPFFLGGVMAYALEPVVAILGRTRMGRRPSVILVISGFLGALTILGVTVIPVLADEISRLASLVPLWIYRLQVAIPGWLEAVEGIDIPRDVERSVTVTIFRMSLSARDALVDFATSAPGGIVRFAGGVISLLVAPLVAVFLMWDGPRLAEAFWGVVPGTIRPKCREIIGELDVVLSGFIRGYLLVALLVAFVSGTFMAILGIRFYWLLGVTAGLTNLIPYFGPFIGAIPALIIAAFDSSTMVLWVAGAYILIQQIESLLLAPRIIGSRTGLHPLEVVFSVTAGGALAGIAGMILGVPVLAIIRVLLRHIIRWGLDLDSGGQVWRATGKKL